MLSLILLIISGAAFAYFATQNTQQAFINFLNYTVTSIPMYLVALVALLTGIVMAWVISFFGFVSNTLKISDKNSKIKQDRGTIESLEKKVYDLQLENERLKGEVSAPPKA